MDEWKEIKTTPLNDVNQCGICIDHFYWGNFPYYCWCSLWTISEINVNWRSSWVEFFFLNLRMVRDLDQLVMRDDHVNSIDRYPFQWPFGHSMESQSQGFWIVHSNGIAWLSMTHIIYKYYVYLCIVYNSGLRYIYTCTPLLLFLCSTKHEWLKI